MDDINLLDGIDFENMELEGANSTVQQAVDKVEVQDVKDTVSVGNENRPGPLTPKAGTKATSNKEKLKEETKGVIEKHAKTVETIKAEEEKKAEKKVEMPKNVVYIDAQNADDRMKVADYMRQGRLVVTDKNRPILLAEQKSPIYSSSKPPIHTIMCDEIVHVTIRKYYLDLELMPVGKRTLAKEAIWVYHKGYQSQTMITKEQLKYLLDKKFVAQKDIYYVYHDISEGTSYFLGLDNKEPDSSKLAKIQASNQKNYNIQTGKLVVPETETEVESTTESVEDIKDAV